MILITGATGHIGQDLIQALIAINAPFRVLIHFSEKSKALNGKRIETVVADFADRQSVQAALQGIDRVFLLLPDSAQRVSLEKTFLACARKAAVKQIVRLSHIGANSHAASPILKWHGQGEQQLENSGLAYTHLRVNWFMQDMLANQFGSIMREGTVYQLYDDARVSLVDIRDVSAVAARILTESGHEGRTYEITGPEALNFSQIAEKLSAHLDKTITYSRISDAMAFQNMIACGLPIQVAHDYLTLFQFYRQGSAAALTGFVEIITGLPPRSLDAYIAENIHIFNN